MPAEPRASSPSRPLYRTLSQKGFQILPLSEEPPIYSARGQHLPHLLQQQLASRHASRSGTPDLEAAAALLNGDESSLHQVETNSHGRRMSAMENVLMSEQMRSQRLIGNSNPRYHWQKYYKPDSELKKMSKPLRRYYERNNYLIQQYMYIDRLLDSSLPHNLIREYNEPHRQLHERANVPPAISEESGETTPATPDANGLTNGSASPLGPTAKVKRTKDLYKLPDEETPLLVTSDGPDGEPLPIMPDYELEEESDNQAPVVKTAIYINLAANTVLLAMKIVVTVMTSSVSVLASLVDAALDFLSTAIVWVTSWLVSKKDAYKYPIGRKKLEPVGVLVFSVIMITSFVQVAIEGVQKLMSNDHAIVQLSTAAIIIMASTVGVKGACWAWCRLIRNSSVQALAQDAQTDVVFNIFSIIFPLIGYYARIWWLDPAGGVLLSLYVIFSWSATSSTHIRNLTGAAASADERNVLLYLTMRFAKTIKQIQACQAYHSGDKIIVEVDLVVDEGMSLRDSHDLGESLQYVLESTPMVDRAFVHLDYTAHNLPSHMQEDH